MRTLMWIPILAIGVAVLSVNISCRGEAVPGVASPEVTGYNLGPLLDPKLNVDDKKKVVAQWEKDRDGFENAEKAADGLGPVYNATSCVACHHNVVTGNASQVAVLRASHREENGDIVEPPGGSLLFQRALDPKIQVRLQPGFEHHTLRMATSVLGDGLIECIADEDILAVQAKQPVKMQGTVILAPVVVGPDHKDGFKYRDRVGRFGWKAQDASLMNFSAGAYLNEMGITSPMQRIENTSMGVDVDPWNVRKGVQDQTFENGEEHIFGVDTETFARFMRASKGPPVDSSPADPQAVARGKKLFLEKASLNCAVCHVPQWNTAKEGTDIGDITVPASLAEKTIEPYTDFMLHDIGTGDGIVQTQHAQRPPHGCDANGNAPESQIKLRDGIKVGPKTIRLRPEMYNYYEDDKGQASKVKALATRKPAKEEVDVNRNKQRTFFADFPASKTAPMIKTAPLWGMRSRPQLMHDGLSLTIEDAILRHKTNEAADVYKGYNALTPEEKADLAAFLLTL